MRDLKELRREIDKVDGQISELLNKRRELVGKVALCKKSKGIDIYDSDREMEILNKANVYDGAVFRAIIDSAKDYQSGIIKAGTFGLISGKAIKSLSPMIHSFFGDYEYRLCPVAEEDLGELLKDSCYDGFNITMPYKKTVFHMCDQLSPECYNLGNVNTVKREIDGTLTGYNTDYYGFRFLLEKNQIEVTGKKALILGTGATAETAKAVLRDLGVANIYLISRNGNENYNDCSDHRDGEILVNCTPIGMYPNNGDKPIELEGFTNLEAVIDVIYNPYKTALILEAEDRNIKAVTGLEMLVAQAGKAAEIFCKGSLEEGDIEEIIDKVLSRVLNRCLIGMPGAGKSFLGRRIAKTNNLQLDDTDKIFKDINGKSPSKFIEEFGEDRFRALESQILKDVTKKQGRVIATGGGVVETLENRDLLRQNGVIIWVKRELEKLSIEDRPISQRETIEKIFQRRKGLYEQWSDFDINNNVDFKKTILVVNGPNLNLLGKREPEIYGEKSYDELVEFISEKARDKSMSVEVFQSNHQGDIIDKLQRAEGRFDGIIINGAGYSYDSVAILDALRALDIPIVEVHLSDISKREDYRHNSLFSQVATEVILGEGFEGYEKALEVLNGK